MLQPQILAPSNGAIQCKAIDFEIVREETSALNKKKVFIICYCWKRKDHSVEHGDHIAEEGS